MRDELREYKRSRIVEEASTLFYERGYEATSVDLIAEGLGVTKPFVYSYFRNKAAILQAIYERQAARLLDAIQEAAKTSGPPEDRLRAFVKLFVKDNITQQVSSGVFLQEEKHLSEDALARIRKIQREFDSRLAELIQEGIDAGVFRVADAKIASLCISGMVRWVHRWYREDGRLTADEVCDRIAEAALNLVCYRGDSAG